MAWRLDQPLDVSEIPAWIHDIYAPWQVPDAWEPDPPEPEYGGGFGATLRAAEIGYYSARQDAKVAWLQEKFPTLNWRDALWDVEAALGRRRPPTGPGRLTWIPRCDWAPGLTKHQTIR